MEPNYLSSGLSSLNLANNNPSLQRQQQQQRQQPLRTQTNNSSSTTSNNRSINSSVINRTPWINTYHHGTGNYRVAMDLLDEELNSFNNYMSHRQEEVELRKQVINIIERVIQSEFPRTKVDMFGSTFTGLFLPDSDIDIVVNLEITTGRVNIGPYLEKLEQVLVNNGITRSDLTEIIPSARVPIIKFETAEEYGSFSVDVSVNSDTGIRGASFQTDQLKRLGPDKEKRVKDLMLVVKQFLTTHNFRNVKDGGIGGLTIFCLVVFFMQKNYQPYKSIGYDLLSFFSYYVNVFPWKDYTIVIAGEGQAVPKRNMTWNDSINYNRLSIQHPIELRRDVARGSSSWFRILAAFRTALNELRRYTFPALLDQATLDSLLNSRYENSILSQIGIRCAPLMHHNRQANHQLYLSGKLSSLLAVRSLPVPFVERNPTSTASAPRPTISRANFTESTIIDARSSVSQSGRIGDRNINGNIYRDDALLRNIKPVVLNPQQISRSQIAPLTPAVSITSSSPPGIINQQLSPAPPHVPLATSDFSFQLPTPPPSARSAHTSTSSSSSEGSISTPDISTPGSISGISTSSVSSQPQARAQTQAQITRPPNLLPFEIESTNGERTFEYISGSIELEDTVDSSTSISTSNEDSDSPVFSPSSLATTPSPVLAPVELTSLEASCASPALEKELTSIEEVTVESSFLRRRARRFQELLLESNNSQPKIPAQVASSSNLSTRESLAPSIVAAHSPSIDNTSTRSPFLSTPLGPLPLRSSVTRSNHSNHHSTAQHHLEQSNSQSPSLISLSSPTILDPQRSPTLTSNFIPQKLSRTLKRQIPLTHSTPSVYRPVNFNSGPLVDHNIFQSSQTSDAASRNNYGVGFGDFSNNGNGSRIESYDSQAAFEVGLNTIRRAGGGNERRREGGNGSGNRNVGHEGWN